MEENSVAVFRKPADFQEEPVVGSPASWSAQAFQSGLFCAKIWGAPNERPILEYDGPA